MVHGVRTSPFGAHAWIEVDGQPIGELYPAGYYRPLITVHPPHHDNLGQGDPDPQTLRRVAALFWPHRSRLVVLGLVVVVSAGLNVGSLLLIKPVFDQALFCPGCPISGC